VTFDRKFDTFFPPRFAKDVTDPVIAPQLRFFIRREKKSTNTGKNNFALYIWVHPKVRETVLLSTVFLLLSKIDTFNKKLFLSDKWLCL